MPLNPERHNAKYGGRHRSLRKRLAQDVAAGLVDCARCGRPILPGEPFDLGHVDGGAPTEYQGAEHRRCNRATAARRNPDAYPNHGAPYRNPVTGSPWSRDWGGGIPR
jgi:hypothetical protein